MNAPLSTATKTIEPNDVFKQYIGCKRVDANSRKILIAKYDLSARLFSGVYPVLRAYILPVGVSNFMFSKDARCSYKEQKCAFIVPCLNESGSIVDLVAFDFDGGWVRSWLGRMPVLGAEQLGRSQAWRVLPVFEEAIDWLRADRVGLVVLNLREAANLKYDCTLSARSYARADELREALTRPAPRIVVRREGVKP